MCLLKTEENKDEKTQMMQQLQQMAQQLQQAQQQLQGMNQAKLQTDHAVYIFCHKFPKEKLSK